MVAWASNCVRVDIPDTPRVPVTDASFPTVTEPPPECPKVRTFSPVASMVKFPVFDQEEVAEADDMLTAPEAPDSIVTSGLVAPLFIKPPLLPPNCKDLSALRRKELKTVVMFYYTDKNIFCTKYYTLLNKFNS